MSANLYPAVTDTLPAAVETTLTCVIMEHFLFMNDISTMTISVVWVPLQTLSV